MTIAMFEQPYRNAMNSYLNNIQILNTTNVSSTVLPGQLINGLPSNPNGTQNASVTQL